MFTDRGKLTGLLPASPVRKGGVKGSYTKMAIFLTGKPRPGGRGGFTFYEAISLDLKNQISTE
jgi:hypothetical protein